MNRFDVALGKTPQQKKPRVPKKKPLPQELQPAEFGGGLLGGQLDTTICREVESVALSGDLVVLVLPSRRAAQRLRTALQMMGVRPRDSEVEKILMSEGKRLYRAKERKLIKFRDRVGK